jgi:hypothetical protein
MMLETRGEGGLAGQQTSVEAFFKTRFNVRRSTACDMYLVASTVGPKSVHVGCPKQPSNRTA